MAICLLYGIPYEAGKFKYSMEKAEEIRKRLTKLPLYFPLPRHTAKNGARYDFTAITDENLHLSAKTVKHTGGKVAPQVIGQPSPAKFAKLLGIEYTNKAQLKEYIQRNIVMILPILVEYTFNCPNIFYNDQTKAIKFIRLLYTIEWTRYAFSWTCCCAEWYNSCTLKIEKNGTKTSLLEFQFHTTRSNMAIRWFYENFLTLFQENLSITNLT